MLLISQYIFNEIINPENLPETYMYSFLKCPHGRCVYGFFSPRAKVMRVREVVRVPTCKGKKSKLCASF